MLPFSQPVMTNTMQHLVSHLTFASTNQGHPFNPLTQLVTLSLSFLNYKNFPNHHFFDTIHLFKNNRDMFTWGLCLDCWVFCCLHNTAGFGLAQSCFRGEYSNYCLENNLLKVLQKTCRRASIIIQINGQIFLSTKRKEYLRCKCRKVSISKLQFPFYIQCKNITRMINFKINSMLRNLKRLMLLSWLLGLRHPSCLTL